MIFESKKLNILIFSICMTFGFLALASQARADYEPNGIVESKNMLSGATVTAINGFQVTAVVPANTTVSIKFSQDKVNYYNSAGVKEGWDSCANGLTNINLTGLGWSGGILFYKIQLTTTDPAVTATVTDAQVDYDGTAVPPLSGNSYPVVGTVTSTDLLSGGVFNFNENSRFVYNITSLPYSTSVKAQFSQDGENWYSSDGTLWGEDTLVSGSHLDITTSLDLSALKWSSATSFYYKLNFYSPLDDNLTPVVADAGLIKPDNVYYSVGQSVADLKTGTPSVTIANGAATFSVAQTGNIGVGDRVTYNTSQIAYISAKTNSDGAHWSLVTATGAVPADITNSVVVSITREFTSLASAEAAASNPTHINSTDLVSANVVLNLPCYYDSGADTTAVTIDGYTTGVSNYIKVYTPNDTVTEANVSQRHQGKWDNGKYRLEIGTYISLTNTVNYIKIDGLQIKDNFPDINNSQAIGSSPIGNSAVYISNNIIWGNATQPNASYYGIKADQNTGNIAYIWNNIIYGFNYNNGGNGIYIGGWEILNQSAYIYNNTVYGCYRGINTSDNNGYITVKNNIAYNNVTDYSANPYFSASSNKNISSDSTAPGINSKINATVSFIDATNKDFHLSSNDTAAKNAGVDLSADANLAFATDIDGGARNASVNAWDIGADESVTQIFRSVGPSATGILESDTSHARNVTLTSGVATFSNALADNIGVGDAVLIDTNNDNLITSADTLLFIHSRTSSTVYTLRTHTGATPSDITVNDTYQIYRAYTSLSNAEAGTKNTSIPITFNGGNRDLVANNEEWNIACYANGVIADTTVTIDGWNTGAQNFIKVYTPVYTNEVGVSQRHSGKWDDGKYNIYVTASRCIRMSDNYLKVEGLQMNSTVGGGVGNLEISGVSGGSSGQIYINNNIIKATLDDIHISGRGISFFSNSISIVAYINNNIIYDIISAGDTGTGSIGISIDTGSFSTVYAYNNTITNSYKGFVMTSGGTIIAKNNIAQNCTDGYAGTFDVSSDYNISDIAADAPGTNSKNLTNVLFIDEANDNFCLSSDDISARKSGLNLSADTNLSFTDDIRGQSRPASPNPWSIGACEALDVQKTKLEGTQVKMEGRVKME